MGLHHVVQLRNDALQRSMASAETETFIRKIATANIPGENELVGVMGNRPYKLLQNFKLLK